MAHPSVRIRRRLAFLGAIAVALMLTGCGVKGPLEPPPAPAATASDVKAGLSPPPVVTGPVDRRRERALRGLGTPSKPSDEFALDPLL